MTWYGRCSLLHKYLVSCWAGRSVGHFASIDLEGKHLSLSLCVLHACMHVFVSFSDLECHSHGQIRALRFGKQQLFIHLQFQCKLAPA